MSYLRRPLDDRTAQARARASAAAGRRRPLARVRLACEARCRRGGVGARGAARDPRRCRGRGDRRRGRARQPGCDLRLRPGSRRRGAVPCCFGRARTAGSASPARWRPRSRRPACRSRRGWRRRGRSTAATRSGSIATRSSSGGATARTRSGVEQLQAAFPDAEVLSYDLPHWNGRAEVMHLMSLISPLDDDLALVYPRLAPVRLAGASGGARDRGRRGAGRGVRVDGPERARARAAPRPRARGKRRDAAADGGVPASRCSSTRATRSPGRATAARRA